MPFDPLPLIAGPALLRRLSVADLATFQAYRNDAEVGRYQGWTPMPDGEALAFLRQMSAAELLRPGEWMQIGIATPHDPALVGDIGLRLAEDGSHAEIGFTLSRGAQGRGIATAAASAAIALVFTWTDAHRVLGVTDARNLRSIRLLERIGMRRVDECAATFRGDPCIEYAYALERA